MAAASREKNHEVCNCSALRRATRHVTLMYDRALADSGLTSGQFSIIHQLRRRTTPPTLGELAQAMVMDRTALTHTLKPLERDGLLVLKPDSEDRRARRVHVTAKGVKKHDAARALWHQAQQMFARSIGEDKADELRTLLRMVTHSSLGASR